MRLEREARARAGGDLQVRMQDTGFSLKSAGEAFQKESHMTRCRAFEVFSFLFCEKWTMTARTEAGRFRG